MRYLSRREASLPLLNRYWNNKTHTVDLIELEKIAKALGVSPGELIVADEEAASGEVQEAA